MMGLLIMNDSRTGGELEFQSRDKTYDLGKGIKVTVARVLAPGLQAVSRVVADSSLLRSPTNSKTSHPAQRLKPSQSPLMSHSRMDKEPARVQSKEPIPAKENAMIQLVSKKAPAPQKHSVIDFSREGRANIFGLPGSGGLGEKWDRSKSKEPQQPPKGRYHNTSRGKPPDTKSTNILKHRSERNLSQNALTESHMSDIPDSGPRALTKSRSFVTGKNITAQFGQFETVAEITYPESIVKVEVERDADLLIQWQELVARCESLEFYVSVGEKDRAERKNWLFKKREAVQSSLVRIKEKLSFILHRLYPAEDDEEVRVRIASLLDELEVTNREKSKAPSPDSPSDVRGLFSSTENLFVQGEELTRSLEILTERKKAILALIRSASGWFEEFSSAGETAAEAGERDERLRSELLSRTEEIEAHGVIMPRGEVLGQGLSANGVAEAAKWVYEDQINRLRVEGIEKLCFHISKIKIELINNVENCIKNISAKNPTTDESMRRELDSMVKESHESLLSFLHILSSIDRAVRLGKAPQNFCIDLLSQLEEKLNLQLPSMSQMFQTLVDLEFDGRTYNRMKSILPMINCLESYIISLFKLRSSDRIISYLEDQIQKSGINKSARTPQTATYQTLLRSLETLCEAHLLSPSSPGHLSASDMSTEPLPPAHLLQLCVFSSLNLSLKKKHYTLPLLESVKQISFALDIFDKTVWVDPKAEILSSTAFLYEFSKLQSKVKEMKTIEIKCIQEKIEAGDVEEGRLQETQLEYSRALDELKRVKGVMSGRSRNEISRNSKEDAANSVKNKSVERVPLKVLSNNQRSSEKSASKKSSIALSKAASKVMVERNSNSKSSKDVYPFPPPKPSTSFSGVKPPPITVEEKEQFEEDPMVALEVHERDMVMEYCGKLGNSQSRNPFLRKLIRLLEGEFNLDQHCIDWIARGVAGIKVRKGPKIPFGYSGSKKIDALETWSQMVDGKIVDLDKMGFGQRVLRFNTGLECFELLKPTKKLGMSIDGLGRNYTWDSATSESLQGYSIVIEEVAYCSLRPRKEFYGNS